MNIRLLTVPVAFAISAAFIGAASSPAMASSAALTTCTTAPAQLRTLAASAEPTKARKALSLVNTGVALCDSIDGRNEGAKKLASAAKVLGTDMASLGTTPTAQ
jgi:hypothetical protein